MKATMKIITIALIAIMMTMTMSTTVLATNWNQMITNVDTAVQGGGNEQLTSLAGNILGFIRNIAVIVAVIALTIIGIKYMVGSAEEKAEYKKTLIPLVVGIVVVVAATQIVTMVFNIVG